jgi:hypothetical protein
MRLCPAFPDLSLGRHLQGAAWRGTNSQEERRLLVLSPLLSIFLAEIILILFFVVLLIREGLVLVELGII